MSPPISGTDPRFHALDDKFMARFGEGLPLMMIPESETIEGLTALVDECFAQGKDLLPERYDWRDDVYY